MTQEDALLGFAESLIFIVHGGSDERDGGLGAEEAFGTASVRIAWSSISVLAAKELELDLEDKAVLKISDKNYTYMHSRSSPRNPSTPTQALVI